MIRILSKKNYLVFCLLYTFFRFLLDNKNERITQYIFFIVSAIYLLSIFIDDYHRFFDNDLIISYLIIISSAISILINKTFDIISLRAILMLTINFVALIIDDPHDIDYKKTFDTIVYLVLFLCVVHNILCIVLMLTDILNLTNTGVFMFGRLKGFTYFSGTGELGLLGLGSSIYFYEKNYNKHNEKTLVVFNLLFALNAVVVILSQSRCSLYSMVFCLIIYIILKHFVDDKQNRLVNVLRTLLCIFVFIIIVYFILYKFKIFYVRKFSLASIERFKIWYSYIMVLMNENIFFGLGPSRYVSVFRNILGSNDINAYVAYFGNTEIGTYIFNTRNYFVDLMPHNEYVRHMVIFGIIGIILIIAFFTNIFIKLIKILKSGIKENSCILYLSIFYFIFPLISGLVENMLSFSNSPRYLENFALFFIIGYINLIHENVN